MCWEVGMAMSHSHVRVGTWADGWILVAVETLLFAPLYVECSVLC